MWGRPRIETDVFTNLGDLVKIFICGTRISDRYAPFIDGKNGEKEREWEREATRRSNKTAIGEYKMASGTIMKFSSQSFSESP